MLLFDLPGGATKGAGIGAFVCNIMKEGLYPDYIVSVSYSSFIAVALAMSKKYPELLDKVVEISSTVKPSDFMKKNPVTKNGGVSLLGIWRAIKHKVSFGLLEQEKSLGVQDLRGLMNKVIGEEMYKEYQEGDFAKVYISTLDYKTRSVVYYDVKDPKLTWDDFNAIAAASGTIAVFTQGSEYKGRLHYDTGHRDQNAGGKFLARYPEIAATIKEVISIYPRPECFEIPEAKEPRGIMDVYNWVVECDTMERSLNDEYRIKKECKERGIKWSAGYLNWIMKSFYDTDPDRLRQLKESSIAKAKDFINKR